MSRQGRRVGYAVLFSRNALLCVETRSVRGRGGTASSMIYFDTVHVLHSRFYSKGTSRVAVLPLVDPRGWAMLQLYDTARKLRALSGCSIVLIQKWRHKQLKYFVGVETIPMQNSKTAAEPP